MSAPEVVQYDGLLVFVVLVWAWIALLRKLFR